MIRFGLIGCGNVSGTYLYVLGGHPEARVTAVADPDAEKAGNTALRYGVPGVYGDYKAMLEAEELDAVIIASPHFAHHEQVLSCASRGLDILCEKPLATRMDHVHEMLRACAGVKFSVMLQRRHYPNTIELARAVREGALGRITRAKLSFSCHKKPEFYSTWRGKAISGGGVLISQTLHRIDQLASIFGSPEWVEGEIRTSRDYIEVEDYAEGRIGFASGVTVDLEANNSGGDPRTLSIITVEGEKGIAVLSDDTCPEWNVPGFPRPETLSLSAVPSEHRPEYYGPGHEIIIRDFIDAILQDRVPEINGTHALASMEIIFAFYRSAREGKPIKTAVENS